MTWSYLALAGGIAGGVVGQILLKKGAGEQDFVAQLLNPATIVGFFFYGVSAILYIIALRKIPVSVAFPSVSVSYIAVALLGAFLYGEPLGWLKLVAIGLILLGVVLLFQS
ncbi:MAG: EamA family transporter [Alphaproteobacteria bacterium]|nr:EamA family transporter [Alphaproteobacteria bacterium]